MTRWLFVCSMGKVRSPTAAEMYHGSYVGLFDQYTTEAEINEKCSWATRIFVMEEKHQEWLIANLYISKEKITVLNIPDLWFKATNTLKTMIKQRMDIHGK